MGSHPPTLEPEGPHIRWKASPITLSKVALPVVLNISNFWKILNKIKYLIERSRPIFSKNPKTQKTSKMSFNLAKIPSKNPGRYLESFISIVQPKEGSHIMMGSPALQYPRKDSCESQPWCESQPRTEKPAERESSGWQELAWRRAAAN